MGARSISSALKAFFEEPASRRACAPFTGGGGQTNGNLGLRRSGLAIYVIITRSNLTGIDLHLCTPGHRSSAFHLFDNIQRNVPEHGHSGQGRSSADRKHPERECWYGCWDRGHRAPSDRADESWSVARPHKSVTIRRSSSAPIHAVVARIVPRSSSSSATSYRAHRAWTQFLEPPV